MMGDGETMLGIGSSVVTDTIKAIGASISEDARKEGLNISPILASFTVRVVTLEEKDKYDLEQPLNPGLERELIQSVMRKLLSQDNPLMETIKMQVSFESLYAMELQRMRKKQLKKDQENKQQLDNIITIGTNLQSNSQVASLYRAIFQLMLANGCVDHVKADRNVEREIAAALESVFPQAGLNAFNMMDPTEKRKQINELVNIVLGIRLFNREIQKGGAGLLDIPALVSTEVDALFTQLENESTEMGDLCFTYSDIIEIEHKKPGSIAADLGRLQNELTNRRQYILLVHQLQHEVLESLDIVKESKHRLIEEMEQLKTLVGLRTSVPKEQVYPKFHVLSGMWLTLVAEREKNEMRDLLFKQLLSYKHSFNSSLLEHDIDLVKQTDSAQLLAGEKNKSSDPNDFVVTMISYDDPEEEKRLQESNRPFRMVKETTPNFMSLPLEHQGYCSYTIVSRGGLLLPGNPSLGIIVYQGRNYSFVSYEAMQAFCEDPDKYIEGVILAARRSPSLIHLLCLQNYVPNSDITDLFTIADMDSDQRYASASSAVAETQTPYHINTAPPDPNYEWNEWVLRRKAIQMADLCSRRTKSTQTNLSHFRRDAETQTYLPTPNPDGTMPGVGTQTGIDKATNVSKTSKYYAGLRGKPTTTMRAITYLRPEIVLEGSNGKLEIDQEIEAKESKHNSQ